MSKMSYSKSQKAESAYSRLIFLEKRFIDLTLSTLLLIVTSPVILYSIYRIKKESPGSLIFTQKRVGLNGELFVCYKLRSMHEDSSFNPYTQDDDNRIFPFGNFMRKMRIDELPQLWNVIKGDMHLIGPRAEWDILVNRYKESIPKYDQRHLVRPGITGLAQVSYPYGRNSYDARKKLNYDLIYIKNWSFGLELMVILKTIQVILSKKGL